MKKIQLSLNDETGQLVETISAIFEPSDLTLFRSFVDLMARVRSCTILQRGMPGTNIRLEGSSGLTFTCEPYANAELYELLHVLRLVILQNEPISFHNVAALLGRRFSSKNFAAHLKRLRTVFKHGEQSIYMQISIDQQPLFDESLLRLWLNGVQYHADAEKAAAWQALEASLSTENTRGLVMNQLQGKVKALFYLEYIINLVLKKSEEDA